MPNSYLTLCARETLTDKLAFKGEFLLYGKTVVVFGDTCLALLVHHEQELYHFKATNCL
jgi:hypothetical protein